jgi:1-acyl-sn-glycerol-3-phosphate acyltransferase
MIRILATYAHTALILVWTVVVTFIFAVIALAVSFFFRSCNAVHLVARAWSRSILTVSGVRVSVNGIERIDARQPYIFMSNHQSNFDIPVLLGHLPLQFRWLAKAELFRIPVFGQAMRRAGYISIDRGDRAAAFESLHRAAEKIREGVSVLIFPEGTRSINGSLRTFKKGGFILAIQAGVPIVPVIVRGTYDIMPKFHILIHPRNVTVEVGEPINVGGFNYASRETLIKTVREAIERGLKME